MYQTRQQKHALNRLLASAGLGALDNPMRLCNELASYVRDHEHFRQLLTAAQPETRRDMYEAMKPYLAFHAKPLDAYMSESGALAEAQQLPTVDADGMLHAVQRAGDRNRAGRGRPRIGHRNRAGRGERGF
jgi:hypothetical protein